MKKLLSIALLALLVSCSKSALVPDQAPQYVMTIHYKMYNDQMLKTSAYECYPFDFTGVYWDSIGYHNNYPDTTHLFVGKIDVFSSDSIGVNKSFVYAGTTVNLIGTIMDRHYGDVQSFDIKPKP